MRGIRLFMTAGAAQAAGLLLIALILRLSTPGVADQYFFFFAWASVPVFIVTAGIMYPLWLRGQACDSRSAIIAMACMSGLIILGQVVAFTILVAERGAPQVSAPLAVMAGTFGVASGASYLASWYLASQGSGIWPAVIGLPPALGGCLAIVVMASCGLAHLVSLGAMIGQALGAVLAFAAALPAVRSRRESASHQANAGSVVALSLRAASGYGFGLTSQTAVLTLSAGSLSIFSVISRLTGGLVAIIVSAAVPPLVNSNGVSPWLWRHLSATMTMALGGAIALGLWRPELPWHDYGSWLGVCSLWFAATALNVATQSAMLRAPGDAGIVRVVVVACAGIMAVATAVAVHAVTLPLILSICVAVEMMGALGAAWRTARFAPTLGWSGAICLTGAILAIVS